MLAKQSFYTSRRCRPTARRAEEFGKFAAGRIAAADHDRLEGETG